MRLWKRKLIVAAIAAAVTPPVSGGDPYWDQLEHLFHFHAFTSGVAYDEVTNTAHNTPLGLGRSAGALYAGTADGVKDCSAGFNGSTNDAIVIPSTPWETKDAWTVEFVYYPKDVSTVQMILCKGYGFQLYVAGGTLYCAMSESNNGTYFLNGVVGNVQANNKYHIAIQRIADGRYYGSINGAAVNMGNFPTKRPFGATDITLGKFAPSNNLPANCYIDEFRVSTMSRYPTANFAPPTKWHPDPDQTTYINSKRYQSKCALYVTFSQNSYTISSGTGVKTVPVCNAEREAGMFGLYAARFRGAASHTMEVTTTDVLGSKNFAMEAFVSLPASTIPSQYTAPIMCQYPAGGGAGSWLFGVREGKLTFWSDQTMYQGSQIVADGQRHHLKLCRHGYYLLGFVDDKLDMVVKFFASLGILDGGQQRKIQIGSWGNFYHPDSSIAIEHVRMLIGGSNVIDGSDLGLALPAVRREPYGADDDTAFYAGFDGATGREYQWRPNGGALQGGLLTQQGTLSYSATNSWVNGLVGQQGASGGCLWTGDAGPASVFKSMGNSNFTVEMMCVRAASENVSALLNNRNGPNNTGFGMSFNPALSVKVWHDGTDSGTGTVIDTVDVKGVNGHIAVIRKDNFLLLTINGVINGFAVCNKPMSNLGGDLNIGGHRMNGSFDTSWFFGGTLDGVRISRIARYLSAKVPQTAFPHF